MGRWQPDARGRLAVAALELYAERGYEQVTVGDIADRAGLTARTFFRHFSDKREVLFAGSDLLGERLAQELAEAPPDLGPLATVATALGAVAEVIGEDRDWSRTRRDVIASTPELLERERTKLAGWAAALTDGLVTRGVDEGSAALAADSGVSVFRVAFEEWLDGPHARLPDVVAAGFDRLRLLVARG